jgi:hypothetical protein
LRVHQRRSLVPWISWSLQLEAQLEKHEARLLQSTGSFSYSPPAACPIANSYYLWFNHPYGQKKKKRKFKYDQFIPLRNRILEESQA